MLTGWRFWMCWSSGDTYALALTEILSCCTWSSISYCDSVVPGRAEVQMVPPHVGSDCARGKDKEMNSLFGCKLKVHFISDELQCFNMKNHSLTRSFWVLFFFFCSIKRLSANLLGCLFFFCCCFLHKSFHSTQSEWCVVLLGADRPRWACSHLDGARPKMQ